MLKFPRLHDTSFFHWCHNFVLPSLIDVTCCVCSFDRSLKMNCILCYFGLILYFFTFETFSYDTSSFLSTWNFRQFAAGNFPGILTESCNNGRISEEQTGKEYGGNLETKLNNVPRTTVKPEGILSMPGRHFALNLTNNTISSGDLNDETTVEGVYDLHLLPSASVNGAACLDGSPPGFYLHSGRGLGKSKWIVFFQGGAWCHDVETCHQRSSTALGSSSCFRRYLRLEGLLSNQAKYNPDYYNYTKVFVPYCDGASFTGDRKKPLRFKNKLLYFRGRRILDVVLDELLRRGIDKASEIILSGRSAGALSAIIHADYIRTRFRRATNASFRVLADAGIFVDAPSLNGTKIIRSAFQQMCTLHNSTLNQACSRAQERDQQWRCLFPQYSIPFVASPMFLVNSLYDLWQIAFLSNIPCVLNLKTCNSTELFHILKFRKKTLRALRPVFDSNRTALFADACLVHTQCVINPLLTTIQVENVTISQAFANWYRGGVENRLRIDCPYPCNLSCPKHYRI